MGEHMNMFENVYMYICWYKKYRHTCMQTIYMCSYRKTESYRDIERDEQINIDRE